MAEKADVIESPSWVMVPVELVRSGASKNAVLCFVSMGSFGKESRARVSTIAVRMRVKDKQIVRDAQTELIEGGFIRMISEAQEHTPRKWALWPYRAIEKQGVGKTGSLKNREPENPAPKQINSNESDNKDKNISTTTGQILGAFKTVWLKHHPSQKYAKGPGDAKQAKGLAEESITAPDVTAKAESWMKTADAYTQSKNHPWWLFIREFNSIKTATVPADGPKMPAL